MRELYYRFPKILIGLFLIELVSNFVGCSKVQAQKILLPQEVNCNQGYLNYRVQTPQGLVNASNYCQTKANNRQQLATNNEVMKQEIAWGKPYQLDGNICRERIADQVCLTPQEAANLRWDIIPSR